MYTELDYRNSLYHHGIFGMHWGKRNGPPYPLGADDHSASEKKAGWRKSLDKSSESQDHKKRGLTEKQKKALKIGAAVAVTALVAYGAYKLYKSEALDSVIRKGRVFTEQELRDMGIETVRVDTIDVDRIEIPKVNVGDVIVNHVKDPLSTVSKRIGAIPGKCNFNSFAGALDREHSITLKPNSKYEDNIGDLVTKCLKNTDGRLYEGLPSNKFTDSQKASEFIFNKIAKGKEGAFGQIGGDLAGGDGHAFNWVVKDGKVHFYDTLVRTSSGAKSLDDASILFSRMSGANGKITRLDGLSIDDFTYYAKELFDIKK